MKRSALPTLFVLLFLVGGMGFGITAAQGSAPAGRALPPERAAPSAPRLDLRAWHYGPPSPFQYQRHDAVFVPGPEGTSWANRVYFLGGRISAPSELPDIWVFDPVTGVYTDTQADMIEDVSNYNSNLIMDDCTGRGPAVYVVGGTNKDGGGVNIALVQRYYPALNLVETLPSADNWPGKVNGITVGGIGTAVVGDKIYAFGGWQTSSFPYFSGETWRLDPCAAEGSRWTNLGVSLTPPRSYIQAAVQGGKIYAMGGIYDYPGQSDLVPTDVVEALDTANLAAGWQTLSPLPVPTAEGRGFGFDSDTLGLNQMAGRLYIAGGGDWPDISREAMEYFVATDTWNQSFPDLNDRRVNNAGTYIPIDTPNPHDGLPGLWVFGGRSENGCDPPYGATEYYPLPVAGECSVLLVDDDWDWGDPYGGGRPYYTSTLEALGYPYDIWDTATMGAPTAQDMAPYRSVVWFTGYDYQTPISPTEEAELIAYLDGGGNLLMSSPEQEYAFPGSVILSDYFWVDVITEDVILTGTVGNVADPLYAGLGPYPMGRPDQWGAYWPTGEDEGPYDDALRVKAGGFEPLLYTATDEPNSTRYQGANFKTVYLAFPLEWVVELNGRMEIMETALGWFCEPNPPQMQLLPPGQAGVGSAGSVVTYTLTLINGMGYTETFALDYGSLWPTVGPATVGPIPDGASADLVVEVTIPTTTNCYEMDIATVRAVAQGMVGYSAEALVTTTAEPAGLGFLVGTVYDDNTELGLPGAHVYVELGAFYTETWADAAGAYLFELPACSYDGGADAVGYTSAVFAVGLAPAMTTTQDLYLPAGWPDLTPESLAVTLTEGQSAAFTMTLANTGTANLNLNVGVVPSDVLWLTVGPYAALVPPGLSEAIPLTLDAAGLSPAACYTATLAFTYDDPYIGGEDVPVMLCVEQGCEAVTEVDFSWTPLAPTAGGVVTFTAAVSGAPTLPISYTWDFADGAIVVTTGTVVTHAFTSTGSYSVTLVASNACGWSEAVHAVTVEALPRQWRIYLPVVQKNG